uniref:VWFA domain-containing protein n=1 Tax=Sphaeramia orbicularis TaxID=375764 RepID=A0A673BN34_9TELE
MMGISKGSSKALCLVIDTTESMRDDIDAVKSVTSTIINSEVGTEDEPSLYILVPFNDPDVGPLIRTKDPENFKKAIDLLSPSGGGDEAEMSLSGLELALTVAPFNSEIFLFTDSSAKDTYLKTTVMALIERTQCVVNFLITDTSTTNRAHWSNRRLLSDRLAAADAQVYRDVAQDSGGQFIEVTKSELPTATSIIIESSSSSLVTILQTARKGTTDDFPFIIDETVTKLRIYITGRSYSFTLTSPSGETQKSTDATGTLITSSQLVGNFQSLQLKIQKGQWKLTMSSTNPYTVKIIGQSPIDFLLDFVVASQGPFSGFDTLQTRPKAGVQGNLIVTLTGSDTATVTEVALVQPSGSGEVKGTVEPQEEGKFLVQVDRMPTEFVVRVKGSDSGTSTATASSFQRQSSTIFRASNVTISADSNSLLTPGTPLVVPFTVTTDGDGGNFTIRATNNRRYESTFPTSLFVERAAVVMEQ